MQVYKFNPSELASCEARKAQYIEQLINGLDVDGKELSFHDVERLKARIKRVNKKIGFQKYLRNLPNQTLTK